MRKVNYREEDFPIAIEEKKKVMHQIEHIEMNFWTDNIEEAMKRTADMYMSLANLNRMQSSKRMESKINQLYAVLNAQGIQIEIIPIFRRKKTD